MKGKFCMLVCVSIVALWSATHFSAVSAQVLIDGHWYPINPNITVPSGDLDVPKNNPTQSASTSHTIPTAAITIYITNTPPPAFVPASGSEGSTRSAVNPTNTSTTTNTVQSATRTPAGVTLGPGYIAPTSVLNGYSAPAQDESTDQYGTSSSSLSALNPSAMVGSLLGAYTRGEQSVLDFIVRLNDKVNSGTARTLIRIVLGVVGVSIITFFVWRWIKSRE